MGYVNGVIGFALMFSLFYISNRVHVKISYNPYC
jgi:hypothetical protein